MARGVVWRPGRRGEGWCGWWIGAEGAQEFIACFLQGVRHGQKTKHAPEAPVRRLLCNFIFCLFSPGRGSCTASLGPRQAGVPMSSFALVPPLSALTGQLAALSPDWAARITTCCPAALVNFIVLGLPLSAFVEFYATFFGIASQHIFKQNSTILKSTNGFERRHSSLTIAT